MINDNLLSVILCQINIRRVRPTCADGTILFPITVINFKRAVSLLSEQEAV